MKELSRNMKSLEEYCEAIRRQVYLVLFVISN